MPEPTVLLTGATGFIGFRILQDLLLANYCVRAVVRSSFKARWLILRIENTLQRACDDGLELVVVQDFTADKAFEQAVQGITFVVHVASPITSTSDPGDWEHDFVQMAVKGSINLLEAAAQANTIRRIVITSSMVAMLPLQSLFKDLDGPKVAFNAESRSQNMPGPDYPAMMVAYAAGKIAALNAAEAWVAEHDPAFDVIHFCPSFVIGRDETARTARDLCKGSNWHALSIILGMLTEPGKPALTCHIDDVTRCHIRALDITAIPGNQCYLISCDGSDGVVWDNARSIVQIHFPDAVRRGVLSSYGHMHSIKVRLDVRKTEDTFDFVHKSYAEQVKDVTTQYLELNEAELRQKLLEAALRDASTEKASSGRNA